MVFIEPCFVMECIKLQSTMPVSASCCASDPTLMIHLRKQLGRAQVCGPLSVTRETRKKLLTPGFRSALKLYKCNRDKGLRVLVLFYHLSNIQASQQSENNANLIRFTSLPDAV